MRGNGISHQMVMGFSHKLFEVTDSPTVRLTSLGILEMLNAYPDYRTAPYALADIPVESSCPRCRVRPAVVGLVQGHDGVCSFGTSEVDEGLMGLYGVGVL